MPNRDGTPAPFASGRARVSERKREDGAVTVACFRSVDADDGAGLSLRFCGVVDDEADLCCRHIELDNGTDSGV